MELRYCEQCGTICTERDVRPHQANERFLCATCRGAAPKSKAGPPAAASPAAAVDRALEVLEQPQETAEVKDFQVEDGLDLFSAKSLILKRQEMSKAARKPQPQARPPAADDTSPFQMPPNESLDLFSAQTLALKKKNKKHKALEAVEAATGDAPPSAGSARTPPRRGLADGGSGALAPAATAKRLQFRCVHCRSSLAIKPVQKLSKLVCSHCSGKMYVDPSGQVSREPPEGSRSDSFRVPGKTVVATFDGRPAAGAAAEAAASGARPVATSGGSARGTAKKPADEMLAASFASSSLGSPSLGELVEETSPAPPSTSEAPLPPERWDEAIADAPGGKGRAPGAAKAPAVDVFDEMQSEEDLLEVTVHRPAASAPGSTAARSAAAPAQSAPVGCFTALAFGLLIAMPLFLATSLIHLRQQPTVTASQVETVVNAALEKVGEALKRAFARLYDPSAD